MAVLEAKGRFPGRFATMINVQPVIGADRGVPRRALCLWIIQR